MQKKIRDIIIAFDGHSSCGKSTLAKQVAKELDYTYIDTGAMYRAVTYWAIASKIIQDKNIDLKKLESSLKDVEITFQKDKEGKQQTFLNGKNVEKQIRSLKVSNSVSYISEIGFVREKLVALQQAMGKNKRIVMDGRDIGTVVFPNAELKIFMTASVEVRAQRRYKELLGKGDKVSFEEVKANIEERDYIDQNRDIAPLRKADDAILLDNSNMTRKEQFEWIMNLIYEKFSINI